MCIMSINYVDSYKIDITGTTTPIVTCTVLDAITPTVPTQYAGTLYDSALTVTTATPWPTDCYTVIDNTVTPEVWSITVE